MRTDQQLDQLAKAWWRFHGKAGIVSKDEDWSFESNDELAEIDQKVEALENDSRSLGQLIEALVRNASPDESLAFVGAWVLDDIDALDADEILRVVEDCSISRDQRRAILSEFDRAR